MIATAAEKAGLIVLGADKDFDLISEATGQPMETGALIRLAVGEAAAHISPQRLVCYGMWWNSGSTCDTRRREVTTENSASGVSVRRALGPEEYPRLVEVWRSAVDATHDFLAEEDRDQIESQLASDYLPQVELYVAESGSVPVGFAGIAAEKLEMLFVDAGYRGTGIGSALLSSVVAECSVRTVDVNEQNEQASAFYHRRGFVVIGRSEVDEQGRPYPILHMALSIACGTTRPVCRSDGSSLPGSL
jgi:putative acetyltransferase